MDLDDFRSILDTAGVDVWTFIDTAILVASLDYAAELKERRDKIVERLYATCISTRCRNCDFGEDNRASNGFDLKVEDKEGGSDHDDDDHQHHQNHHVDEDQHHDNHADDSDQHRLNHVEDDVDIDGDDDDEIDPYGGLFDDEQKRVLDIKEHLEDPDQTEDSLVDLLQSLADMDITFQALKETDIGRHVNSLRKHSSNDVRRLVKHLVRKWKVIVDEWVKLNPRGAHETSTLMAYGDSPQLKIPQNGHHQVPDFAYSPNPHNASSGSDKNNSEPERKGKLIPVPRRESTPIKPPQSTAHVPQSVQRLREQQKEREQQQQKVSNFDAERLASARKRLQANYKEAANAKKQRTIQVMDIHEIPKPKNSYFGKNKGSSSQGRHW